MHFFEIKAHEQHQVLISVVEDAEAVIGLLQAMEGFRGGEGAGAAAAAQAALKKLQAEALAKPEDQVIRAAILRAEAEAIAASSQAQEEESRNGFEFLRFIVRELVMNQYGLCVRIISKFYGKSVEELERDCDVFELLEMGIAIVTHEKVLRFFPQLRRLARLTQSDT